MARYHDEVRITISVLDRLIDYEPEVTQEAIASRSRSLRQLKLAVRRDLEWLLNTREYIGDIPSDLRELHHSVAVYGLPDFTSTSIKDPNNQERLRRAIEEEIRLFEPRLEAVTVTLITSNEKERAMHFRIDGQLRIDPVSEPVSFDTHLEPGSGHFTLKGE
ncbi:MAG: type VI secretion system baseplate subunit TssE [Acidobacteria bacterium]|nr:type VI secretion system baseplate subunit TssE [Acidobacteriota bacterium]MCI0623866.1 type VI secretion system baseplate subunit TssE [Acidobacteriota bacterium]MCI0718849.1 type VI secretion system baseplate subunit TssE [Acidobacteriota bacterium]